MATNLLPNWLADPFPIYLQTNLKQSNAQISIAVTGIAGPGGGTEEKPVGLVYIAAARDGEETLLESQVFDGGRDAVRIQAVAAALALVRCRVGE